MSELSERLIAGDRRALAQAITLVESHRPDHRAEAVGLLDEVLPRTGSARRIGISGAPGAGKSTMVEALGLHVLQGDHELAVLAVDPTSNRSGGSILGDKTRMSELSRHERAFIRPSPSGRTLGGVARRTRESVLLCEAAGFDVVLVETVGVGQSEVAVAELVDLFVLLTAPGGGDELQGIKRGIMELADLVLVNKADGDLVPAAQRSAADLKRAVHLLRPKRPGWEVEVLLCSALEGDGIAEAWTAIDAAHRALVDTGALDQLRGEQAVQWMWSEVTESLLDALRRHPGVAAHVTELEREVTSGTRSPAAVAALILADFGVPGSPDA